MVGGADDDAAAFVQALHVEHGGALLAYAQRALGDRAAAEEVVQDTLLRAWRSADRFDPARGDAATWLFAIERNLVIDRHRARGRDRSVSVADPEAGRDDAAGGDGALDRALDAWQVADALARLSPPHRAALVETFYRGRTTAEAARVLGVPQGTVKSRVYYGLRALRVVLEEMGVVG